MSEWLHSHGYVLEWDGRIVYQHRRIAEEALGRPLRSGEQVHHRNGDKADNRPESLDVVLRGEHQRLHVNNLTDGEVHELLLLGRSYKWFESHNISTTRVVRIRRDIPAALSHLLSRQGRYPNPLWRLT